jgi:hypothetical protein
LGSITNEEARDLTIKTDFLNPEKKYKVSIYADGPDAHWNDNPQSYVITYPELTNSSEITLKLAAGGGAAISFMVVNE